MSSSCGQTERH